jgi:hypothetical protein
MRPLLYRRALRQPAILALNGLVVLLIGFDICHHLEIRRLDPHHLLTVSCKMRAMIACRPATSSVFRWAMRASMCLSISSSGWRFRLSFIILSLTDSMHMPLVERAVDRGASVKSRPDALDAARAGRVGSEFFVLFSSAAREAPGVTGWGLAIGASARNLKTILRPATFPAFTITTRSSLKHAVSQ